VQPKVNTLIEQETREESNKIANVRPLECLELHVPPTSATESANRGHGVDSGTDTDGDACAPETIHRNRKTSGFRGDGWIGYVWVATVQQLVKE